MSAMNKIATAYVQIEPTTKNLKANLTSAMNPASQSAGTSAAGSFADAFKTSFLGISMAAVGTAIAKKLVEAMTESVNNYSDYEQLTGGVEKLFKSSADLVKQYAEESYKTAGVSANEYMETVTKFSATLIKSLNGDTKKAAELSNQAIIDMSDNANTFGTDIASIQNAYQGFAKQNYTMLDNLNLGFAGTKEGMQQLLKMAEGISKQHYDISNLSDVITAIHVVQESMGIAGKTAEEAATTIEGSLKSVKASWTNLSTEMGKENGNIDQKVQELSDSVTNFANNLTPTINRICENFPVVVSNLAKALHENHEEIVGAAKDLIVTITTALIECEPDLIECGAELMTILAEALIQALPILLKKSPEIAKYWADSMIENKATTFITPVGNKWAVSLVSALMSNESVLQQPAVLFARSFAKNLSDNSTTVGQSSKNWVETFTYGVETYWYSVLLPVCPGLAISFKNALENDNKSVAKSSESWVASLKDKFKERWEASDGMLGNVQGWVNGLATKFLSFSNVYGGTGHNIIESIRLGLKNKWDDWVEKTSDALHPSNLLNTLKTKFLEKWTDFYSIGVAIKDGIWNGIKYAWNKLCYDVASLTKQLVADVKRALGIKSPSKVFAESVGKWIPYGIAKGVEDNMSIVTQAMNDLAGLTVSDAVDGIKVLASGNYTIGNLATSTGSSGFNQTVNVYSPTQLDPSEVARQTRNSTRQMVLALRGV